MRATSRGGGARALLLAGRRTARLALLAMLPIVAHAGWAIAAPTVEISSARFGNVFTTDEPPVFVVTMTAGDDAFRGRVIVHARDAYGRGAGLLSRRVRLRPGETGTQEFSLRTLRLGHFVVNATLVDAGNLSRASASATAGIVPPVDGSDPEGSGVGYFVFPDDSELSRADEIAAGMRRLGIRWVRLTFNWWLDARRDRPDVSGADWLDSSSYERWVDAFRANGIEVLGVLFGTARWASSAVDREDVLQGGMRAWGAVPPLDVGDWELFVRTLAERLRGRVRSWEVWNEPDITPFWIASAADFVTLARVAEPILRAVDPGMRVVVNLVNRDPGGIAFTDEVLAGAGDILDVFGFHYGAADVRDYVSYLRPGVAAWNTESYGVPRRHISRWLAERAAGVERLFPFIYHTLLDDEHVDDFHRFGRYPVNLDYTPRPDGIALRTLSDLVGSAPIVGAAPAGLGYFAYHFLGPSGAILALADGNEIGETWAPDAALRLTLRVGRDVRRVTVVDLMGNRKRVRVRRGRLRILLQGVATFLLAEPGTTLDGVQVERSEAARRPGRG
jgi:hypothetical protein